MNTYRLTLNLVVSDDGEYHATLDVVTVDGPDYRPGEILAVQAAITALAERLAFLANNPEPAEP